MPNNYETRELDFNSDDGFGRNVADSIGFAECDDALEIED
jgi:hypothetical protein